MIRASQQGMVRRLIVGWDKAQDQVTKTFIQ